MRLTLEIVNARDRDSVTLPLKVFGPQGGTIGRAPECDWVLSDPHISRQHAVVSFLKGVFYLESFGVNGVGLNSPNERLSPGERRPLNPGDHIFIDDYEIAVRIASDELEDDKNLGALVPPNPKSLDPFDAPSEDLDPLVRLVGPHRQAPAEEAQRTSPPSPGLPRPFSEPSKPRINDKLQKSRKPRVSVGSPDLVDHYVPFTDSALSRPESFRQGDMRNSPGTQGCVYPVWYATNRRADAFRAGFSSDRSDTVSLGRINVLVPESHRFSEIGTSFWKRLLRFEMRDDHLRIQTMVKLASDEFYSEIAEVTSSAKAISGQSSALVFLHGFNVTFEDAAIRAAQIGYDLKVQGPTALFSWPSCGKVAKYAADEASIEASESFITDFLIDFAANCGADRLHLIAHSMGNRGLLRGLQRIAARAEIAAKLRFEQIFLAAPDVDRDVFIEMSSLFARHCTRATLYASSRDLAVFLSKRLHGAPRAGYVPPYTVVKGIDTVEVPNFNVDLLGHSYFAQADALLHDMYDLMQRDAAPNRRQRIETKSLDGQVFWALRR